MGRSSEFHDAMRSRQVHDRDFHVVALQRWLRRWVHRHDLLIREKNKFLPRPVGRCGSLAPVGRCGVLEQRRVLRTLPPLP